MSSALDLVCSHLSVVVVLVVARTQMSARNQLFFAATKLTSETFRL